MDSPKSDLLQGTLDMLVLKVVALEPIHGYGIAQRMRQISNDVLQVQQGSLYPALHRLEKRGWLKAEWGEAETGRDLNDHHRCRNGWLNPRSNKWLAIALAVLSGAVRRFDRSEAAHRVKY
jgi:PadR family transcriptional regulator, regulatory protein PadR